MVFWRWLIPLFQARSATLAPSDDPRVYRRQLAQSAADAARIVDARLPPHSPNF